MTRRGFVAGAVLVLAMCTGSAGAVVGPFDPGDYHAILAGYLEDRAAAASEVFIVDPTAPAIPVPGPPPTVLDLPEIPPELTEEGMNRFFAWVFTPNGPLVAWFFDVLGTPLLPERPPVLPNFDSIPRFTLDTAFGGAEAGLSLGSQFFADLGEAV